MNRRALVPIAAAALLGTVLGAPRTTFGATASGCRPQVDAVTPTVAGRGEQIALTGSGFACESAAGGAPTISVGGRRQTIAGAGNDTTLVFRSDGDTGGVQVSIDGANCPRCPDIPPSNSDRLLLAAPVPDGGTQSPVEGGRFSVTGAGFGFAGFLEGVAATACGSPLEVRGSDDRSVALTSPSTFCRGPVSLDFTVFADSGRRATDRHRVHAGDLVSAPASRGLSTPHAAPDLAVTVSGSGFGAQGSALLNGAPVPATWFDGSVTVTVQPRSTSGRLVLTRDDGRVTDAGHLTVDSQVMGVSARSVRIGDTLTVDGAGFGASGSVSLGGTAVPGARWSPIRIVLTVPRGATSGDLVVTPSENTPSPPPGTIRVDIVRGGRVDGVAPPPPPAPRSAGPGATTPPIPRAPGSAGAPAPLALVLHGDQTRAGLGRDIALTVTLAGGTGRGAGVPVDLLLAVSPGSDATLQPSRGVTDANGRVSAVVHLSRRAGEHIVLARSGSLSDELTVTGCCAPIARTGAGAAVGAGSALTGQARTAVVTALLACLVLFLAGFGMNLATSRTAPASVAASRRRRCRAAGALVAPPRAAGSALQYAAAMGICVAGQLLAAARRSPSRR